MAFFWAPPARALAVRVHATNLLESAGSTAEHGSTVQSTAWDRRHVALTQQEVDDQWTPEDDAICARHSSGLTPNLCPFAVTYGRCVHGRAH